MTIPESIISVKDKRILHEMELLYINFYRIEVIKEENYTVFYIKDKTGFKKYTFILHENYPFKLPEITLTEDVNPRSYADFLVFHKNPRFNTAIRFFFPYKCICCHSFMSRFCWLPSNTCLDIIKETEYMYKLKEKIYIFYLIEQIAKKNKMNTEDIIFEIATFIYTK